MSSHETPHDAVLTIIHVSLATVTQPYRNAYACKGRHKIESPTWSESIAKKVAEAVNRAYRFRKDGEAMSLPAIEAIAFQTLAAVPITQRLDYASGGPDKTVSAYRAMSVKIRDALAAEHEVCFEPTGHKSYYPAFPMGEPQ